MCCEGEDYSSSEELSEYQHPVRFSHQISPTSTIWDRLFNYLDINDAISASMGNRTFMRQLFSFLKAAYSKYPEIESSIISRLKDRECIDIFCEIYGSETISKHHNADYNSLMVTSLIHRKIECLQYLFGTLKLSPITTSHLDGKPCFTAINHAIHYSKPLQISIFNFIMQHTNREEIEIAQKNTNLYHESETENYISCSRYHCSPIFIALRDDDIMYDRTDEQAHFRRRYVEPIRLEMIKVLLDYGFSCKFPYTFSTIYPVREVVFTKSAKVGTVRRTNVLFFLDHFLSLFCSSYEPRFANMISFAVMSIESDLVLYDTLTLLLKHGAQNERLKGNGKVFNTCCRQNNTWTYGDDLNLFKALICRQIYRFSGGYEYDIDLKRKTISLDIFNMLMQHVDLTFKHSRSRFLLCDIFIYSVYGGNMLMLFEGLSQIGYDVSDLISDWIKIYCESRAAHVVQDKTHLLLRANIAFAAFLLIRFHQPIGKIFNKLKRLQQCTSKLLVNNSLLSS